MPKNYGRQSMNSSLFDLSHDVAVVIGGTGTLGRALGEALASFGARVGIVGRNAERGANVVETIDAAGGQAQFYPADALDREALISVRESIQQELGEPTVLVNAAGGNRPEATLAPGDEFSDLPRAAWQSVFDLNLVGGTFVPCQVFGETMLAAGRGSVINIASMAGMTPLSRVAAYSAAKAAVINLTKYLAREWADRGVRVNAISPGFFPAEQNMALLLNDDGTYTDRGQQIVGHTPMGRFGRPAELAGAVVWLSAENASSFVTGQNIAVDGGFSCMTI
jgi:NAD(P)-dependent dehydrogenase (short-subunit alcohol dehydrogenase family)